MQDPSTEYKGARLTKMKGVAVFAVLNDKSYSKQHGIRATG